MIQSFGRRLLPRFHFLRYKAATNIQAAWRSYDARSNYRKCKGATKIQAAWRSFDGTMTFLHFLTDVIMIQGVAKAWLGHRAAPIKIQAGTRGYFVRQQQKELHSSVMMQCAWRQHMAEKELRRLRAAMCSQKY
jgi:hypothetical protein